MKGDRGQSRGGDDEACMDPRAEERGRVVLGTYGSSCGGEDVLRKYCGDIEEVLHVQ